MKAIVLSLPCLTLFAGSASAECAWVLWSQTLVHESLKATPWMPGTAYLSGDECVAELDRRQVSAMNTNSPYSRTEKTRLEVITEPGKRTSVAYSAYYQCLQDTMDPRGPKGK